MNRTAMPIIGRNDQLTLEVKPNPELDKRQAAGEPVWIQGALEAKLDVPVSRDLNDGDTLHVRIADNDGEVLAALYLEVRKVRFDPIEDKDLGRIGTTRVHLAKIAEA